MGVGLGVSMTGEMLDAASNTGILQTLQVVGHHRSSHVWVIAEGSFAYDYVLRISIYIGYWSKIDIEAVILKIGTDGIAAIVGIGWVACLPNSIH